MDCLRDEVGGVAPFLAEHAVRCGTRLADGLRAHKDIALTDQRLLFPARQPRRVDLVHLEGEQIALLLSVACVRYDG